MFKFFKASNNNLTPNGSPALTITQAPASASVLGVETVVESKDDIASGAGV